MNKFFSIFYPLKFAYIYKSLLLLVFTVVGCGSDLPSADVSESFDPDKNCAFDFKQQEKVKKAESIAQKALGKPTDPPQETSYKTPTVRVHPDNWPDIADDLNFNGMLVALDKQIARYDQRQFWESVTLGQDQYNLSWTKKSLKYFRQMVVNHIECLKSKRFNCEERFTAELKMKFNLYMPELKKDDPRWGEDNNTLFTAYYTPTIQASHTQSVRYPYAVYKMPSSDSLRRLDREKIDFDGQLTNKNLELFYTNDLFDLYIMQIEGGGHLIYNDQPKPETQYVSYAGTNRQPWRFISKYMLEKNYISDGRIETQRDFLEKNKDKHREIYSSCPSYVYFKKTDHEPLGSDMVTLTPNRSLATDDEHYKFKGLLVYVQSQRPIEKQSKKMKCQSIVFKPFSRFYLDQDTGGAIIGKSRADLYFGEGEYAEVAAHSMVQRGQIYFLMLKRE